jgi:hypothetical protein
MEVPDVVVFNFGYKMWPTKPNSIEELLNLCIPQGMQVDLSMKLYTSHLFASFKTRQKNDLFVGWQADPLSILPVEKITAIYAEEKDLDWRSYSYLSFESGEY